MSRGKFIGHVLRYIGIYDDKNSISSGYRDKFSDKTQKKSDLQTHNTQFGKRRDIEKWKKKGAALRRLSNRFYEDRVKVLSERSGVDSIAAREDAQQDANLTRCLGGVSAKFWSSGTRVFCAYYEKESSGKYGMYFTVFAESDTRVIRVSDTVFTKSEAKRAPPEFVMREEGDTQKVIFTFLVQKERGEDAAAGQALSFLCVYQYTIKEQDRSIVAEQLGSIISSKNYLGFEGPLGITVHSDGNIMVIGKYKDPSEIPPSDAGYFAWRFSGTDLAPIKAEDSQPYRKTYLFCIFGGSAYKDSERMVVWKDERENQISITHIDKRLVRQRSVYSTVYDVRNVDMIYREHMADKCLVESFRCGIAGPKTSVLRNEDMHLMDNVSVEDERYIFYISQESNRRANGTVDMLMFSGDTYMLVEGVFRIEFSATSLSVNPANNGNISIFLTEKGGKCAHVYEIPSGDELFKSEILVKTATIDCKNAGRREFMDIIGGGSPLHGTVETVTDLETSITNGSLKNMRRDREYKGNVKIVDYGVYELKNNVHSPSHVVTEKSAQSAADAEHHTVKREVSVSATITTPVESIYPDLDTSGHNVNISGATGPSIESTHASIEAAYDSGANAIENMSEPVKSLYATLRANRREVTAGETTPIKPFHATLYADGRLVIVGRTTSTLAEPIGKGSSVSGTAAEDLPSEEPSSTTSSPLPNSAGTTAAGRVVATEVHKGAVNTLSSGGYYIHDMATTAELANLSRAGLRGISGNATGASAVTGASAATVTGASTGIGRRAATMVGNYTRGIGTGRRFVSLTNSLRNRESKGSVAWVIFGVIAVLFLVSVATYVYKLLTGSERGESNSYRNIHDYAVEEDVSFIQLEPRNAAVDEIPSTLCMDSISASLTSYDCGSVHEL